MRVMLRDWMETIFIVAIFAVLYVIEEIKQKFKS